jgi:patatin-like phospholipase/acyl hydrolase
LEKLNVLSLDGGGVRGYLSAMILKNIKDTILKQTQIHEEFDLIVGTSTGSIIAAALAIGKPIDEITDLYLTLAKEVFIPTSKGIFAPKYSNDTLKKHLDNIFGDLTLADVKRDLCITSVDIENSKPRFHKSRYFDRNTTRLDEKLADVVLASCAAPTYFSPTDTKHSTNLVDGGMVANNPSLVAFTDAMQIVDNDINKIKLLSIGTGEHCHMPYDLESLKNAGKKDWMAMNIFSKDRGSPIIELILEAQSKLAAFQTGFLLKDKYLRINPSLSMNIKLDDIEMMENLKNVADLITNDESKLKEFLNKDN